jgi:hypothetical protein
VHRAASILAALWVAAIFQSRADAAPARAAEVRALVHPLERIRDGATSFELIDSITTIDEAPDRPAIRSEETRILCFARTRGTLRQERRALASEPRSGTKPPRGRPGPTVALRPQEYPAPEWLFTLPETMRACNVSITTKGRVKEAEVRLPKRAGGRLLMRVVIGAAGLPIAVTTFDIRGKVLDERTVEWAKQGKALWPVRTRLVAHGRTNRLTVSHEYSEVRLNVPLSGSLFDAP